MKSKVELEGSRPSPGLAPGGGICAAIPDTLVETFGFCELPMRRAIKPTRGSAVIQACYDVAFFGFFVFFDGLATTGSVANRVA